MFALLSCLLLYDNYSLLLLPDGLLRVRRRDEGLLIIMIVRVMSINDDDVCDGWVGDNGTNGDDEWIRPIKLIFFGDDETTDRLDR